MHAAPSSHPSIISFFKTPRKMQQRMHKAIGRYAEEKRATYQSLFLEGRDMRVCMHTHECQSSCARKKSVDSSQLLISNTLMGPNWSSQYLWYVGCFSQPKNWPAHSSCLRYDTRVSVSDTYKCWFLYLDRNWHPIHELNKVVSIFIWMNYKIRWKNVAAKASKSVKITAARSWEKKKREREQQMVTIKKKKDKKESILIIPPYRGSPAKSHQKALT